MKLQVLDRDNLTRLASAMCRELTDDGADGIFVNCNSLTAAINMDSIRSAVNVKVVTPLDAYTARFSRSAARRREP